MLTAGEMAATSAALEDARRAVEAAEAAAGDAVGWFHWTPLGFVVDLVDGTTRAVNQAEDRAATARRLFDVLRRKRDDLVEAPGFDHEASAEVVTLARRLASHAPADDVRALLAASPLNIAWEALKDTADQVTGGGPPGRWNPFADFGKVVVAVLVIVAVVTLLPILVPLFAVRPAR